MSNREKRTTLDSVHIYIALARPCHGQKADCIRTVDKGRGNELELFIAKIKAIGGNWRIHRTVNARSVEKARIWLLKDLIDHPEHAGYIDSQWRTALLQPECKVTNNFMLDIDTQDEVELWRIAQILDSSDAKILEIIKTPKGYHYITEPFDTREVCKLPNVTLLRDGYYFICEVKQDE